MRRRGYVLRSGHAIGCDQAFELGACSRAELYLPWRDFECDRVPMARYVHRIPDVKAIQMVPAFHPAPERLSMAAVRLHARNCHILLGANLEEPVRQVICWTPDEYRGGTSFGLRVAREYGIHVDNLYDTATSERWSRECDLGTESLD